MAIQSREREATIFATQLDFFGYIFLYYYHSLLQYYKSLNLFQKFFEQNS